MLDNAAAEQKRFAAGTSMHLYNGNPPGHLRGLVADVARVVEALKSAEAQEAAERVEVYRAEFEAFAQMELQNDLLWSDPIDSPYGDEDWGLLGVDQQGFAPNSSRECPTALDCQRM